MKFVSLFATSNIIDVFVGGDELGAACDHESHIHSCFCIVRYLLESVISKINSQEVLASAKQHGAVVPSLLSQRRRLLACWEKKNLLVVGNKCSKC